VKSGYGQFVAGYYSGLAEETQKSKSVLGFGYRDLQTRSKSSNELIGLCQHGV
jgi:hypothetical protein